MHWQPHSRWAWFDLQGFDDELAGTSYSEHPWSYVHMTSCILHACQHPYGQASLQHKYLQADS
jgi:hypothetical protein